MGVRGHRALARACSVARRAKMSVGHWLGLAQFLGLMFLQCSPALHALGYILRRPLVPAAAGVSAPKRRKVEEETVVTEMPKWLEIKPAGKLARICSASGSGFQPCLHFASLALHSR